MAKQRGSAPLQFLVLVAAIGVATAIASLQRPDESHAETSFAVADLLKAKGWLNPIEFNPVARLPFVGTGFNSVGHAAEERAVWTAGNFGAVLFSADGGASWQSRKTGSARNLFDVVAVTDEVVLLRSNEAVAITQDRGNHWKWISIGQDNQLRGMSFEKKSGKLWVATVNGKLLSLDAMEPTPQWNVEFEPRLPGGKQSCGWTDIVFDMDHRSGLFNCDGAVFERQEDGKWQAVPLPSVQKSGDFFVFGIGINPDGRTIWLGGDGRMWSKSRAQENWIESSLPKVGARTFVVSDFVFVGKSNMMVVRDGGRRIFRTVDRGETWRQLAADIADITDISVPPVGNAWITASDGGLFEGSVYSDTWTRRTTGANGGFRRIIRHPSMQGEFLVLSVTGRIYESKRGGRALSELHAPVGPGVLDMALRSSSEVWQAASSGRLIRTEDGRVTTPSMSDLWTIRYASNGKIGLAGGNDGAILVTLNEGETWDRAPVPKAIRDNGTISEVFLNPDGKKAYAVTGEGFFLTSTSEGLDEWSWEKLTVVPIQTVDVIAGRVWVAGAEGLILSMSQDGEWRQQRSGTTQLIYRIRFAKDGQKGIAVGNGGAILTTSNGGADWHVRNSGTKVNLRDVAFDETAQRYWIVGWGGTLLLSEDAGVTWSRLEGIEGAVYRRFPAPWFWAFLLLVVWKASSMARELTVGRATSIPAIAVSDNPITRADEDRFGFLQLAKAISQFVRNVNTRPPFIIALTGEWGSGKSSVMQLLRSDLLESGYRPIWWNAWHYQDENTALASAMEHIRSQGIPFFFSFANLRMRLRLLNRRLLNPAGVFLIILFSAIATIAWLVLVEGHGGIQRGWEKAEDMKDWGERFAYLLGVFGLFGIAGLVKTMRPFSGASKSVSGLIGKLSAAVQIKSLPYDAGVRYKFSREFGDLSEALEPSRMVMIIDDLDRCHPDRVVNVLETVNFLVTAGRCIVILGMDLDRVLSSLAVAFDKVAKAAPSAAGSNAEGPAGSGVQAGHAYAMAYIRKMINLEVNVPTQGLDIYRLLFTAADPARSPGTSAPKHRFSFVLAWSQLLQSLNDLTNSLMKWVRRAPYRLRRDGAEFLRQQEAALRTGNLWRSALLFTRIVVLILLGWFCGNQITNYADNAFPAELSRRTLAAVAASRDLPSDAQQVSFDRRASPTAAAFRPNAEGLLEATTIMPGNPGSHEMTGLAVGLFAVAVLFGLWRTYFAGPVRDSRAFERAMRHWGQPISQHLGTPREMKRFLNRVRFAALRVRVEQQKETGRIRLWRIRRFAARLWAMGVAGRDAGKPILQAPATLDEETLVRLASCQVCGHDIVSLLRDPLALASIDGRLKELLFDLRNAAQREAALALYMTILGGVRY